ncbi:D-2-hydroxyacid dehydrogenase [Paenibacillus thermoaerophilus]|uniref:D-2-hydroxyacid dehydrogenase n=1 Tax=Paenibacillus thermoaerophilus TaxID=1215385 RepID=A0ABW2UWS6_9BACL|nr:D-2-hydroxyacid dehydrogenase [Paenibacillus thermoaerophilus]TMV15895.1 D-2-hydroxyacid dehydrogenase [Paenibacillus thermoaerophilus]
MKIVVLDGYTANPGDLSWSEFEKLGTLTVYDRTPAGQIIERAADAEAILTNKVPLDAAVLSQLPKLRYIGVLATGYNIVDTAAASERGIVVTNVPDYSSRSVTQLVFAFLLEFCHHVQLHSDAVHAGQWSRCADFHFANYPLFELAGRTLGIVGYGSIGRQVAEVARAFGMEVVVHTRTPRAPEEAPGVKFVSLEELLSVSDAVTLHCPLTPDTAGLINSRTLGLMKRTAFLINTARGGHIVEQDLADALNEGRIAGAGLDVLSVEPPPADHPLLGACNCWVTPHIGWATREARKRLLAVAAENLKAYLGGSPANRVNG